MTAAGGEAAQERDGTYPAAAAAEGEADEPVERTPEPEDHHNTYADVVANGDGTDSNTTTPAAAVQQQEETQQDAKQEQDQEAAPAPVPSPEPIIQTMSGGMSSKSGSMQASASMKSPYENGEDTAASHKNVPSYLRPTSSYKNRTDKVRTDSVNDTTRVYYSALVSQMMA